ncbi:hypothetical protein KIPB_007018, partial [Kipferlia bialata]|eukprot:g7018.t1
MSEVEDKLSEKRNRLHGIASRHQGLWSTEGVFERDAPEDFDPKAVAVSSEEKNKFMITFPYPYMNGMLHLGHLFSLTKAEFAAGYQRVAGKNVLFPFSFHCTGMPISAAALRLEGEIRDFGCPPVFPKEDPNAVKVVREKVDLLKFKAKKGKAAGKKSRAKYQWEIMESMGLTAEQIPDFVDPYHWCRFFPQHAKADLKRFGARVDWRRSFTTTDMNPFYDSFIKWQFRKLHTGGYLRFGRRNSVWSVEDNQPCLDHDRSEGEGVGVQEYVVIKMNVQKPYTGKLAALADYNVFLGAATLRPETMYGQTNCWALPEGDYGAYQMNETDVIICSERAAENMAFQEMTAGEFGCLVKLADIKGSDLFGVPLSAPNTPLETIYVLPLMTIKMDVGTGIVTSVPSDAPDDYQALVDLKRSAEMREQYGIK